MIVALKDCSCCCRYWYFGNRTSAIITRDLSLRAPFAGRSFVVPGLTVVRLVDVFVAVNAYTTYPLLVVVLQVHVQANRMHWDRKTFVMPSCHMMRIWHGRRWLKYVCS